MGQVRREVGMTDLARTAVEEISSIQNAWRASKIAVPGERWFTTLELEAITIQDGAIVLVCRDPADGVRHGWRYECRTLDDLETLSAYLAEDLMTTDPTLPDENGVRWWGINDADESRTPWWAQIPED